MLKLDKARDAPTHALAADPAVLKMPLLNAPEVDTASNAATPPVLNTVDAMAAPPHALVALPTELNDADAADAPPHVLVAEAIEENALPTAAAPPHVTDAAELIENDALPPAALNMETLAAALEVNEALAIETLDHDGTEDAAIANCDATIVAPVQLAAPAAVMLNVELAGADAANETAERPFELKAPTDKALPVQTDAPAALEEKLAAIAIAPVHELAASALEVNAPAIAEAPAHALAPAPAIA